jgi:hypothetical protein
VGGYVVSDDRTSAMKIARHSRVHTTWLVRGVRDRKFGLGVASYRVYEEIRCGVALDDVSGRLDAWSLNEFQHRKRRRGE